MTYAGIFLARNLQLPGFLSMKKNHPLALSIRHSLFFLLVATVMLSYAPSASALRYDENDRESKNVEDRRTGPGSLSPSAIARECQKVHLQPSYPDAATILATSVDHLEATIGYLKAVTQRLDRLPAKTTPRERALACLKLVSVSGNPLPICDECQHPAVQAKCLELKQVVDRVGKSCVE
jgi:hypothetical protein